jgi:hypothetical protein
LAGQRTCSRRSFSRTGKGMRALALGLCANPARIVTVRLTAGRAGRIWLVTAPPPPARLRGVCMDRSWMNAFRTAGAAAACAMLATVLWDGLDPAPVLSHVQSAGEHHGKRMIAVPAAQPPAQETADAPVTTYLTMTPMEVERQPEMTPQRTPVRSGTGPMIEEPDLPGNFI